MKREPISCRADNALAARCQSFAARWACVLRRPILYLAAYIDNNAYWMPLWNEATLILPLDAFLSQSTHAPWNRKSQNLWLLKWIIPGLRVLALTKRHVGSGNEIGHYLALRRMLWRYFRAEEPWVIVWIRTPSDTCGRENFCIRKEKVADSIISG